MWCPAKTAIFNNWASKWKLSWKFLPHMHSHNIETQAHQTPNKLYKEKQRNLIYTILMRLSLPAILGSSGATKNFKTPMFISVTVFERWWQAVTDSCGCICHQKWPVLVKCSDVKTLKLYKWAHDFLIPNNFLSTKITFRFKSHFLAQFSQFYCEYFSELVPVVI